MTRDLGTLAEADLLRWAAQINLSANKSTQDREGWDFFIQVPYDTLESAPLDRRDPRIECLIQVKGVGKNKGRKSIELSNLEKLVKSQMPTFFLIIVYKNELIPQEAFIVHVGDDLIEKTLKRLREVDEDSATSINKKTLDIVWNDKHKLPKLDGHGLITEIEKYIPEGMRKYTLDKLNFLESAGNPISSTLKISIQHEEEDVFWNKLIDFSLGIDESIQVSEAILNEDIRFSKPAKTSHYEGGTIKFTPKHSISGKLIFKSRSGIRKTSFPAEFRTPSQFIGNLTIPPQYFKERVIFELGELIIRTLTGALTLNIDLSRIEKSLSLRECINYFQLIKLLDEATIDGCVVETRTETGKLLSSGQLVGFDASSMPQNLLEIATLFFDAYYLIRLAEQFEPHINFDDLFQQRRRIDFFKKLCDPNEHLDSITWIPKDSTIPVNEVALPFVEFIKFGDQLLVITVAIAGNVNLVSTQNEELKLEVENPRTIQLQTRIVVYGQSVNKNIFLDEIVEELEAKGFDVVVININNLIR